MHRTGRQPCGSNSVSLQTYIDFTVIVGRQFAAAIARNVLADSAL